MGGLMRDVRVVECDAYLLTMWDYLRRHYANNAV